MTIAGAILLTLLIALFIGRKLKSLIVVAFIVDLFFEMGYATALGSQNLNYKQVSLDFVLVYCLLHLKDVSSNLVRPFVFLSLSYVASIIILYFYPSDAWIATTEVSWDDILFDGRMPVHPSFSMEGVKMTVRMISYLLIIVYVYSTFAVDDYKWIIKKSANVIKIFLILGIIEFFVKNVLFMGETWGSVLEVIFGYSEDTVYEGRLRGNSYELNLFTREASHYAYILFVCTIVLFTNNVIEKKRKISLSLLSCIFLIVFSTSFSSLLFLSGFLLFYLSYRWYILNPQSRKKEIYTFVFLVSIVAPIFTLFLGSNNDNFVGERLVNMLGNFGDFFSNDWNYGSSLGDGSSQVRIVSVIQTLIAFTSRPFFGLSWGTAYCHGATAQFLASVGIVGAWLWIKFYFYNCSLIGYMHIIRTPFLFAILLYLFVNLFNSLGYRPFYGLCPMFFCISCCYVFKGPGSADGKQSYESN